MAADGKRRADRQLGVFAKYWQPGAVKTRLAADIGPDAAAAVHRESVAVLLHRLSGVHCNRRVLAYSPAERVEDFSRLAGSDWTVQPQSDGDLGSRMHDFFQKAFLSGAQRVVLVGSDSPTLPLESVLAAFDLLRQIPVVLGPSEDGGYYLIGAKGSVPDIFENIDWSTDQVWSQTISRLERRGVDLGRVRPWYDVDVLQDLQRLDSELNSTLADDSAYSELRAVVRAVLEG